MAWIMHKLLDAIGILPAQVKLEERYGWLWAILPEYGVGERVGEVSAMKGWPAEAIADEGNRLRKALLGRIQNVAVLQPTEGLYHIVLQTPIIPYVRMTQRSKWVSESAQRYLANQQVLRLEMAAQKQPMIGKEPFALTMRIAQPSHHCDLSNLAKAVEDAGNKVLWEDDCWIDKLDVERGGTQTEITYHLLRMT